MTAANSPLLQSIEGGVLTATINVPEVRNSIGAEGVRDGLAAALDRLESDPALRAMVITGAGGTFSSGGDLRQLAELGEAQVRERLSHGAWLFRRIALADKPVIAAVEGAAFGAGVALAACCDVVVAAQDARFCCVFVRVGAMPDAGLFWSLPLRVGIAQARRMMLFAEEVGGERALAMGLADFLAEPGAALATAQGLAATLAAGPTRAYGRIKAGLRQAPMSLEDALAFELGNAPTIFASGDFKEGARAFLEKRAPRFEGR